LATTNLDFEVSEQHVRADTNFFFTANFLLKIS
jgi:hypothetical protein